MKDYIGTTPVYSEQYDGALLCPVCGNAYTHHERVEVWFRDDEDSEEGTLCEAGFDGATVKEHHHQDDSPSGRRDGVRIYVSCEECDADFRSRSCKHRNKNGLCPSRCHHDCELTQESAPLMALEIYQHKGCTLHRWSDHQPKELNNANSTKGVNP